MERIKNPKANSYVTEGHDQKGRFVKTQMNANIYYAAMNMNTENRENYETINYV